MLQLPALPTEGEWDMGVALAPHPGVAAIAYGGIHGRQAGLFVTTDGGAHWRQANAASSVAGIERANDWTGWLDVEFDESGRLHLAGQLAGDTTSDLYLTRSPDLGRSWRRAVLVGSNSGNPHLTVAGRRLYLSWGLWEEYRLHVAWSEDGGASWRRASNAPADCINVSEVAIAHDTPYVVCAGFRPKERNADYQRQNPFTGLRVYRLDPSGALRLVTTLDAFRGAWPHLLATRDGELILAANVYGWFQKARWFHHCCAAMARSADGQVWSAPLDLRPLVATPARPDIMVLAARLDAEGLLHLLAIGHGTKADSAPRAGGGIGLKGRILHLVLDPTAGRLIGESVLSGELSPAVDSGGQTNVAMTFRGDMGLVAWNEGRTLYVARIEPAGEGGH